MQESDGFDAAPDDDHIQKPEAEEAGPERPIDLCDGWPDDDEHGVDGLAADPGLNAEPAAGNERTHDCGNVCAADSERGANEDREWDAVFGASVGVQQHWNEHDEVAHEDRAEGLLPIHALGDE